jgi:hypothetical protein
MSIHLNANYIYVEPMQSRSKEEMIRAYKKIINRMRLAGLGLKKHRLNNKALEAFKNASKNNKCNTNLSFWVTTNKTTQSAQSKRSKCTSFRF